MNSQDWKNKKIAMRKKETEDRNKSQQHKEEK